MIGTIILAGAAVIIITYGISIYNSFVRLKNNADKAWKNIDVLLKQRNDELNKLLNSVKGYMKFEKEVLENLTKARTSINNAQGAKQTGQAENQMQSTLKSLFAVAENYPDLKSSENFIQFQNRISEIENQISDRREFYNDSVTNYNIKREQVPYSIIANMFNYDRKELFEVSEEDKKDIKVEF